MTARQIGLLWPSSLKNLSMLLDILQGLDQKQQASRERRENSPRFARRPNRKFAFNPSELLGTQSRFPSSLDKRIFLSRASSDAWDNEEDIEKLYGKADEYGSPCSSMAVETSMLAPAKPWSRKLSHKDEGFCGQLCASLEKIALAEGQAIGHISASAPDPPLPDHPGRKEIDFSSSWDLLAMVRMGKSRPCPSRGTTFCPATLCACFVGSYGIADALIPLLSVCDICRIAVERIDEGCGNSPEDMLDILDILEEDAGTLGPQAPCCSTPPPSMLPILGISHHRLPPIVETPSTAGAGAVPTNDGVRPGA